jgi:hypothetical protein
MPMTLGMIAIHQSLISHTISWPILTQAGGNYLASNGTLIIISQHHLQQSFIHLDLWHCSCSEQFFWVFSEMLTTQTQAQKQTSSLQHNSSSPHGKFKPATVKIECSLKVSKKWNIQSTVSSTWWTLLKVWTKWTLHPSIVSPRQDKPTNFAHSKRVLT